MTPGQKDYIEILRTKRKISTQTLDGLCRDRYGAELGEMNIAQASQLIDALKDWTEIQRDLLKQAGQMELFPEVMA